MVAPAPAFNLLGPKHGLTPLGRDSLTYPVFAAMDRRLLVVLVPVVAVLEARVLPEDLDGGFGGLLFSVFLHESHKETLGTIT